MSRTNHASKGPGYDYWKGRLHRCDAPGDGVKAVTCRRERRTAKHILVRAMQLDVDPMFPPQSARMND